jgi:uncharacterized alpha-E superfamily protein
MDEEIDPRSLLEQTKRINSKLDSFRESFEARFDQQTELIKPDFKSLSLQISTLKNN